MTQVVLIGAVLALTSLALADALFEDVHIVKMDKGQYGPRGMPGDIIVLNDNRLLLCYTSQQGAGIVGRYSEDLGRTWGEEFVLVPNPGPPSRQGYYCHPSFVRCPNGDILLSYIYVSESLPYYGHNYYRRSSDECRTWSEQFVLTPHPGYCIMHNDKLRVLSTGRIVAPTEYKKRWPDSNDHGGYVALVFYSDDNGYSWQVAANDVDMDPHEAQEAHIAELKNGTLLMIFRTYSGVPGRAYSDDKGVTWSQGELIADMPLPQSGAVTLDRIPSTGDLLLIRITGSCDGKRRAPLTAMISRDEGATWSNPRDIGPDPEDDYGYQSVDFVGDLALVSYHARDGLHVARIPVRWFYEGE